VSLALKWPRKVLQACAVNRPKNTRSRYLCGVGNLAEGHRNIFHPATTFLAERLALGGAILGGEEGGEDWSSRTNYRYVGGMCESIYAYIGRMQVVDYVPRILGTFGDRAYSRVQGGPKRATNV